MNDITFAASRLAARRAEELAQAVEHRRQVTEREAGRPSLRQHSAVRAPWLRLTRVRGIRSTRPAV